MNRDRRSFLGRLLGTTAGIAATRLFGFPAGSAADFAPEGLAKAPVAGNPLRFPAELVGTELVAQVGRQEVWPGEPIPVWTLGGSYPAPTIRAATGERVSVRLRNELPEETIVHWHGLVIPHDMDGHPMDAVPAGGSFDYSFELINRAGTYWYHPHPHGRTAPQVYMGMAGLLIISDEQEQSLGLPSGELDIALLVQDRRSAASHRFDYDPDTIDRLNGFLGDTILVNGTPDAYLEVSTSLYRVRVLNGSNARILKLGFANGKKFHVIGTDGGLLDKPYEVSDLMLGPAERVELLIDFSDNQIGDTLELGTLRFLSAGTPTQHGYPLPILRFDVTRSGTGSGTIPETLLPIERLDPTKAARTQRFELQTMPSQPEHEFHHINGRIFDMHRIDATAGDGDIEIWEIVNLHIMPHPIHIHGVQFQVLERINGLPPSPTDNGWKDTILVWKEETVRVIMRFGPYRGVYLLHCHNLEHEDGGMMINYEIGESVSGAELESLPPRELDLR